MEENKPQFEQEQLQALTVMENTENGNTPVKKDLKIAAWLKSVLWISPILVFLCLFAMQYWRGAFTSEVGILTKTAYLFCIVICLLIVRFREPITRKLIGTNKIRAFIWNLLIFISVTGFSFLTVELPANPYYADIPPAIIAISAGILFLLIFSGYFLFQRSFAAVIWIPTLAFIAGQAQYYVGAYKGTSLTPADLYATNTAVNVAGSYAFETTELTLISAVLTFTSFTLLALGVREKVAWRKILHRRKSVLMQFAVNLIIGALCTATFFSVVNSKELWADFNNKYGRPNVDYFYLPNKYNSDGFIDSFITVYTETKVEQPSGYSSQSAQQLIAQYAQKYDASLTPEIKAAQAQFAQLKPSVIFVLNETYADLSKHFSGTSWNDYAWPSMIRSGIEKGYRHGLLYVPVLGGATANTEFEVLTGNSLRFFGGSAFPYMMYDFSESDTLLKSFKAQGYDTTLIHPTKAEDWNRDIVYPQMGIDEFLDLSVFDGYEWKHAGVSDRGTYEKTLEVLNSGERPQFIFDITMQNHSGYTVNLIDTALTPQIQLPGVDEELGLKLNQYLGLVHESDRDLQWFIEQLQQVKRPVVLLFFGDHQPNFTPELGEALGFDNSRLPRIIREHATLYAMWANFPLAGTAGESMQEDLTTDLLGLKAVESIGMPLNDFQKAKLAVRRELPILGRYAMQDRKNEWIEMPEDQNLKNIYRDIQYIEYVNIEKIVQ